MQRMPPNLPPRQSREAGTIPQSPALNMARRIRSEQGAEQARQYLMDMEPYLAPAERNHIASQIGVNLPKRQENRNMPQQPAQPSQPVQQGGAQGSMNPLSMLGGLGGMGGMNGGNPMQLLQMLGGGLGGGNGNPAPGGMPGMGGMGNIMQLAQMMQSLGPLMGGKK